MEPLYLSIWRHLRVLHLDVIIPIIVLVWLFSWIDHWKKSNTKGLPHPPGPKPLPVIGNVLDIPKTQEWLKVAEWAKVYGDLVYVRPVGRPMLFVNSYRVATDLLHNRSAIYSSRPRSVMVELTQLDWIISNMPYGEYWRSHRSLLQKYLEKSSLKKYVDYQLQDAHKLLGKLLEAPDKFRDHMRYSVGATSLRIAYGLEAENENDPYIILAEEGVKTLAEAATPGTWIVEVFTWLRYIPTWVPGVKFKRFAKIGSEKSQNVRFIPYQEAKKEFLNGTSRASMLGELIEYNMDEKGQIKDEEIIMNSTGAFFAGGVDTSVSTLLTFILAMLLFPDVQHRAQDEIDRVVGPNRLPTFEDLDSLPYVNAICKETLRWQPAVPLGAPHVLTRDDVYDGYFLPKGTIVFPNQWYMLHDSAVYPDPDAFKPERHLHLNLDGTPKRASEIPLDPAKIAFGFGRRICPGQYMVANSLFILISSVLATFLIEKAIGPDGEPMEPNVKYLNLISHPAPFEAKIAPRSSKHARMIRQVIEAEHTDS